MARKRNGQETTDFGARMRFARINQRMSQGQLAQAMGVTTQQIQKYESGANRVATTRMPALCKALKIRPDDLYEIDVFGGTDITALPTLRADTLLAAVALDTLPAAQRKAIRLLIADLANVDLGGDEDE